MKKQHITISNRFYDYLKVLFFILIIVNVSMDIWANQPIINDHTIFLIIALLFCYVLQKEDKA